MLVSQGLDIGYLLDRLCREDKRVFLTDGYAIFNPDAETPEGTGPPLVVGNIDTRLDSDAMSFP